MIPEIVWYKGTPVSILTIDRRLRANLVTTQNKVDASRVTEAKDTEALRFEVKITTQALTAAFQQYLDRFYKGEFVRTKVRGPAWNDLSFRGMQLETRRFTTQFGENFIGFTIRQNATKISWCFVDFYDFLDTVLFFNYMKKVDQTILETYFAYENDGLPDQTDDNYTIVRKVAFKESP